MPAQHVCVCVERTDRSRFASPRPPLPVCRRTGRCQLRLARSHGLEPPSPLHDPDPACACRGDDHLGREVGGQVANVHRHALVAVGVQHPADVLLRGHRPRARARPARIWRRPLLAGVTVSPRGELWFGGVCRVHSASQSSATGARRLGARGTLRAGRDTTRWRKWRGASAGAFAWAGPPTSLSSWGSPFSTWPVLQRLLSSVFGVVGVQIIIVLSLFSRRCRAACFAAVGREHSAGWQLAHVTKSAPPHSCCALCIAIPPTHPPSRIPIECQQSPDNHRPQHRRSMACTE